MRLPADKMMPSFANLKDYGNTSSSTTWYSFAYIETVGDVKKGQVVMQVGRGISHGCCWIRPFVNICSAELHSAIRTTCID
jgi:3-ketoacyl-CoA synthase